MLSINRLQAIGIAIVVVTVLSTSGEQLVTIFGTNVANIITAFCTIVTAILGGILTLITGQSGLIQQVKAMPGVANIQITADAPKSIAQASLDPKEDKLEPAPGEADAVKAAAKA